MIEMGLGVLKRERVALEKEKEHFKELMEKEKVKLKQSEQKFKAEVSERNKTFFERELSIRKNEDKFLKLSEQLAELAEQNSEKESRLRRKNLDFLIREKNQREVCEKEEARIALAKLELSNQREALEKEKAKIASDKLELSNEREADAKRLQKENEILVVRENNQLQKEDKFRNDNKPFSSTNEDKTESRLTGREEHQIEVTLKRVNTVVTEKRKTASRKSLMKKEKRAKEIMTDDHEWVLERAFMLVTFPFKVGR